VRKKLLKAVRARTAHAIETGHSRWVLAPEALEEAGALLARVLGSDEDPDLEVLRAVGELYWMRVQALPVDEWDEVLRMAAILYQPVYQADPDAVPEQLRSLYAEQARRPKKRKGGRVDPAACTDQGAELFDRSWMPERGRLHAPETVGGLLNPIPHLLRHAHGSAFGVCHVEAQQPAHLRRVREPEVLGYSATEIVDLLNRVLGVRLVEEQPEPRHTRQCPRRHRSSVADDTVHDRLVGDVAYGPGADRHAHDGVAHDSTLSSTRKIRRIAVLPSFVSYAEGFTRAAPPTCDVPATGTGWRASSEHSEARLCTARTPPLHQWPTAQLREGTGAGGEGAEFGCGASAQQESGDEGPHRRAGVGLLGCLVFGSQERAHAFVPASTLCQGGGDVGVVPRSAFHAGQALRRQCTGGGQGRGGVAGGELGGDAVELDGGVAEAAAVITQRGGASEAGGDGGGLVRQLPHPLPVPAPCGTVGS
jgi:hypothetical protein